MIWTKPHPLNLPLKCTISDPDEKTVCLYESTAAFCPVGTASTILHLSHWGLSLL